MRTKKVISLLLALVMVIAVFTGCNGTDSQKSEVSDTRKETLFVTGMQWNPAQNFNWFSGWPAWPTDLTTNPMVYETLFMFNTKTNEITPLLGDEYIWEDDYTLVIKMNPNAKFSDGEALNAEDVLYTLDAANRTYLNWSGYWENIDSLEMKDDLTLVVHLNKENYNRMNMTEMLTNLPILPEHIWSKIEEENNFDYGEIGAIFNDNPVGSGPYLVDFHDDTQIRTKRNEDYWGKDTFGMPAPRYISHLIYNSNDTSSLDLKNGTLDYSQNFHSRIWEMADSGVKSYLSDSPYYMAETIPSFYINVHRAGLENKEVRRALAYALNYPEITEKAMSGYSKIIEPGLAIFEYEKELLDQSQIEGLTWGFDLDKANAILDELGATVGADGIRVLPDGTRLGPWNVECPAGWTDWNATIEIACQNAKAAGIELVPTFTEWGVYDNNKNTGEFDITMYTPAAYSTPVSGWKRAYDLMSSIDLAPIGEQAFWNFGRYENERVNEIIKAIGMTDDKAELTALYTELNVIYLTDIPTIPLYYRPTVFFSYNENVWKNFQDENSDLPDMLFDGAGFRGLFQLSNQ
ncbi:MULTISPECIES: ABC transporter substrate-binding protein [unclassified Fusibacter]|uniref:ABC transporter substrate-binding protein n=1 Tax=unclassified Fusibacter TaxID=2624464 RepID=UPI001012F631|nr:MULTISPECIES: ABC transporter substrate-binding protein [unclassified Fusibacter]MCK8060224.1 ABC transporter substrate-binding protein [Fusibacter sp. A2]NPE22363.1 ABC transporter substrate-binding protein [Fusibacter sp. A1]RXV61135.1 ABC transporter substrate-binding protein [Fusibacter sp. A1]